MKLKLGQPVVDSDDEWFRGHLHGVNLYSSALDEEEIFKMSQNCQMEKVNASTLLMFVYQKFRYALTTSLEAHHPVLERRHILQDIIINV